MKSLSLIIAGVFLLAVAAPAAYGQESGYSRKGADTCLSCHDDETTLAVFRTKHAVPSDSRGPFGHGQLQCEACHGPGDTHAGRVRRGEDRPPIARFASNAIADVEQDNAMCLNCHEGDVGFGWHAGAHPTDEVGCADCHSSHAARDAVLQTATQPEVCDDCHQLQRSESQKAFAHPLFEGKMDCTGCHDMHGDTVASQLARLNVNATCEQ